jgi:hypothetical protein
VIEEGFAPEVVERVLELVRDSTFKRHLPLICDLGHLAEESERSDPGDLN